MSTVSSFPIRERTSLPAPLPLPDIPTKTILDFLDATGLSLELTEDEKTQFVSVCQAFGLNPFKREVYATVYGEGSYRRFSVIVGYEVYLKRAERTGRLDGWSSRIEGTGNDMKAIVEISRKDWAKPLIHEVYFVEAVQKKKDGTPTSFWTKMPRFQLKKVCISQAFRQCFPDELGGLPYDSSELPDAEALASAPPVLATPSPLPLSQVETAASEVAPSPEASSAQGEPSSAPEAGPSATPSAALQPSIAPTIRFLGYQDPYPEEPQDALLIRLEHYLDDNYSAFTERHRDWIFEKAKHSRDRHGVLKMLSYSEKVVRNASAVASA
jgi:phage recombination protein Bet